MNQPVNAVERRDRIVAGLLSHGTWIASAAIAIGLALQLLHRFDASIALADSGYDFVKAGVVIFIGLPIARVALLFAIFLRARDYTFVALSALVLAIIGAGVVIAL